VRQEVEGRFAAASWGEIMTHTKLFRVAAVAGAAAGLMFVLMQFIHPDETIPNVTTTTWKAVHVMALAMWVLAAVGLVGMYLRQVEETGMLGFVAIALYVCGLFIIFGVTLVEAAVLPRLAADVPRYVQHVMTLTATGQATGDIGGLAVANVLAFPTYLVGGVLFGMALWRARVLSRGASALLAIGALSTFLIQVLPDSLDRVPAIPVGVAWAALSISLWRSTLVRRESAHAEPQGAAAV
jgi:hypothetical protein